VRSFHPFNTDRKLEIAPFVDCGKVFAALCDSPLSQLHVGGGAGLRLVASAFVVGYLDIGTGSEKLAVFSGIDYPCYGRRLPLNKRGGSAQTAASA